MSFQMQYMLGNQVLVTGTDIAGNTGSTMLDSTQWEELKARQNFDASVEAFDAAVSEFFAPLVQAVEAVEQATTPRRPDPMAYVVLSEAVEGVKPQAENIVELTRDSIVIRLIEAGDTDRLVWVDSTTIGVLAAV